jgi:hypothetical protein
MSKTVIREIQGTIQEFKQSLERTPVKGAFACIDVLCNDKPYP